MQHSRSDWAHLRRTAINNHSLSAAGEVATEPRKERARNTNVNKGREELAGGTLSKALERSNDTATTEVPLSRQWDQSLVAQRRAS